MSFDIFERFATDENLEVVGVWHNLDVAGKSRIKVARLDNPKYQAEMSRLFDENMEQLREETDEQKDDKDSKAREVMTKAIAKTVLVDWEGISYKGKVLKYSVENAEKVLSHRDFLDLVFKLSNDISFYRIKEEAEQVKN